MADLADRVGEILTRYSMAPGGCRLGVAVSGGADSVVLLHLLDRLKPQFRFELTVLHLNHQLRGAESDGDEQFVRDLAGALGYPCLSEQTQLPEGNLEQAARDARRAFFGRVRNELGLQAVALGHTRSDQAETVLYRFLRGSGTAGLAGMRPVTRDGLIRPLLGLTREEVRDWAVSVGVGWREDSSNADPRFIRNRLRNELLPGLIREFNSSLEAVLAGTADLAQAEEHYWNEVVSTLYGQITKQTQLGSFFQIDDIQRLHPAVRRRFVRRALCGVRGDLRSIDLQHVDAILSLCHTAIAHDRVIIPGVDALRSFGTLLLTEPGTLSGGKRHYRADLRVGETTKLPFELGRIRVEYMPAGLQNCAKFEKEESAPTEVSYLNSDVLRGAMNVRNWEPGDALQRPGHSGPEKLKFLFQEHRILLWERRHWPVVVSGDDVVWARQFGCSDKFAPVAGEQPLLRLGYWV